MDAMQTASALTFAHVWAAMGGETILVIAGFALMVLDLLLPRAKKREGLSTGIGLAAVLLAGWRVWTGFGRHDVLPGMAYLTDDYGTVFKLLFLGTTALILLHSLDYVRRVNVPVAEYTYLLLFATVGAMVMASSLDLVTLFVGLELLSISSYILVGIRKRDVKSNEASMKYLVVGSVASAMILYGMSFLYGLTGTTSVLTANKVLYVLWGPFHGMAILSLLLMFAGFAVKIAVVPFHQWAPDTYEGAPTPVTSFLATLSKAAGFAMMLRVLIYAYAPHIDEWYTYLAVVSAVTMVLGNVAALVQRNVKRLLAFSSIAQAGYILVPFAALGHARSIGFVNQGMAALCFYLIAYTFMTAGAFAVVTIVGRETGSEDLDGYTGLYKRSPWLAAAMAVFLLSLAGMPLTAGFTGKFFLFVAAVNAGFSWLAALLFLASVVSFYYYFGIVKKMYMEEPADGAALASTWPVSAVVAVSLAGTVVLGVLPGVVMKVLPALRWFG
jgi:NADH-quinone oxidoreductase subunit N